MVFYSVLDAVCRPYGGSVEFFFVRGKLEDYVITVSLVLVLPRTAPLHLVADGV